ncbi:hypothetical protein [Mycobacteroides abscessus]|uniref:hypothetical protein n=1 Tax=Mycobacteroides abscessus TaxID=36809 RepID=UPI00092A1585|nr:hypothetical protein [Mycobacteroides abscessus]SIC22720.1 Uncharacterised protein [Mycobacteroides abscessus subsp. abscessus]
MILPYGQLTAAAQRDIAQVCNRFAATSTSPAYVFQAARGRQPWLDPALSADQRYVQMWAAAAGGAVMPLEEIAANWYDVSTSAALSFFGVTPNAVSGLAALAEGRGVDIEDLKDAPGSERQS